MPVNITDVDAFTDPITAPNDGDAANGANFQSPVQKLANRTRRLKNRVDFLTSPTSKYLLNAIGSNYFESATDTFVYVTTTASTRLWFPIDLRDGDVITSVDVLVYQGNAGAGGRMFASVMRQAHAASALPTITYPAAAAAFTAGAGFQSQTLTVASNGTINKSLYTHYVLITSSTLAATVEDSVMWAKVNYTPVGT